MVSASGADVPVKVSIIAPVFNVAPYIRECLESLRGQDLAAAYEVILVDDCSTDASAEICREFAARHPDIFRLVECETNSGVSVARNLGLEQARGSYLMFVDPDDVLPPTALSDLVDAAERFDADIVKGNLVLFDESGRRPAPDRVRRTRLVSGDDVLSALYRHDEVRGHVGGKLFRRDRFGQLRLPVGVRMAQDLLYFSEMFSRARSLALLDKDVYHYRKHGTGSTGRKYEKGSYVDWLGAVEKAGDFAGNPGQRRAHRELLLRTMTQIARECRDIQPSYAEPVLRAIEQRCAEWDIRLLPLLFRHRLGPRPISRYIKLWLALGQIRRKLSRV